MIDLSQDISSQYYVKYDQLSFGECEVYLKKDDIKVGYWYHSNQKIKNIVHYNISRDEMLVLLNNYTKNKPYIVESEELLNLKLIHISENFLEFLLLKIKNPYFIVFNDLHFLDLSQDYQLNPFNVKNTLFSVSQTHDEYIDAYHMARWTEDFHPWICDLILNYHSLVDPLITQKETRNEKLNYWHNCITGSND